MSTTNPALRLWVAESAMLTQPDRVHWCTGSDVERDGLVKSMLASGDSTRPPSRIATCIARTRRTWRAWST
jgi:GTP-dependent phosphoenolpyruvate carboxykinase